MSESSYEKHNILFYDGVCGFCNFVVRLVSKIDKKNKIKFCSLQKVKEKGLLETEINTLFYFSESSLHDRSTAVLYMCKDLGFPFSLFSIFIFLPRLFRDFFYRVISKFRYFIFGRKDVCSLSGLNEKIISSHVISPEVFEAACDSFQTRSNPVFLKAHWQNLVMVNYEVDPEVLKKYAPTGIHVDSYHGKTYVSLVAFLFLKTRMYGIPVPFHTNFEEVNLRFYLKSSRRNKIVRGVAFVKEIVPRFALAFFARFLYGEKYVSMKMSHQSIENAQTLTVEHVFGQGHKIQCVCDKVLYQPEENSVEEFIMEHYFGYAQKGLKTVEYEVKHPKWSYYKIKELNLNIDFESLYGKDFAFLNGQKPCSSFLALGSEVTVHEGSSLA